MTLAQPHPSRPSRFSLRTRDRHEAETVVSEAFLPNSVEPLERGRLDVRLDAFQLDVVTVGLLSYGVRTRLRTGEADNYHVNVPVQGRVISRMGTRPAEPTAEGQAAVFMPRHSAEIEWTEDSEQLCLMIPAWILEQEVEELTGRSLKGPLEFQTAMDLSTAAAAGWRQTLQVLVTELERGPGLASHPRVARQLERVLIDGLLLAHRHSHSDALASGGGRPTSRMVAHAVQLLEEQPERPWSTSLLAREVHSSVRALQERFASEAGLPPMAYLRQVRLRRARERLDQAVPGGATVAQVASGLGFEHLGRFSAVYREKYGELPSATLRR